ncbi:hypothetical protein CFC21_048240 [Triticum aestivum]|uniref:DUF4220 domain-containing protein n=2 Tax=Triticum aestivum TaxID=4565 RepID=A0A9R1K220_WHEAT|nr:hypothetical protein CFC21_048240 [Triticum aestivum]
MSGLSLADLKQVVMEAVIKLHNIQHKGVADLVTEDNPLLSLSFSSTPLADAALLLIGGLIFLLPIGGCDQAITKGPPNRKWFVVFRLVLAFVRFVLNMVFLRRLSPRTCRMVLDTMLDHLGIPRAIYRRRMYSQNTLTVNVLFYWRKMHAFEYFC